MRTRLYSNKRFCLCFHTENLREDGDSARVPSLSSFREDTPKTLSPKAFVFHSNCLFTLVRSRHIFGEGRRKAQLAKMSQEMPDIQPFPDITFRLFLSRGVLYCFASFRNLQRMHNISPPPLSDSTLFFSFALDGLSASEASCFVSEIQSRASFPSEACALSRPSSSASAAPQLFLRNSLALFVNNG